MPFLFINHNVINDYQHINIKSEKQFGIIPSYIIAHYISGSLKSPFNSADIIDFLKCLKWLLQEQ